MVSKQAKSREAGSNAFANEVCGTVLWLVMV